MTDIAKKPRATPVEVEARMHELIDIMGNNLWVRGKSAKVYAKKWGLSLRQVEQMSAEAWRRVCAASKDADKLQPKLAGGLFSIFEHARSTYQYDAAIKAADVLSKITGARAAERHEHAHIVAHYDALDKAGKIEYCRATIREAEETIAILEAEGEAIQ